MCQNDAGNQTESHFEKPTDGFVVEFSRQLQSHGSAQAMCVTMCTRPVLKVHIG